MIPQLSFHEITALTLGPIKTFTDPRTFSCRHLTITGDGGEFDLKLFADKPEALNLPQEVIADRAAHGEAGALVKAAGSAALANAAHALYDALTDALQYVSDDKPCRPAMDACLEQYRSAAEAEAGQGPPPATELAQKYAEAGKHIDEHLERILELEGLLKAAMPAIFQASETEEGCEGIKEEAAATYLKIQHALGYRD